jgi:hypothetical protein
MSDHAQRLREMVDGLEYLESAECDACLYGARCIEIVESIAAEPNDGGCCDYCGRQAGKGHEDNCCWKQAREAQP